PNFAPTGRLAAAAASFAGTALKWTQPPDAREPSQRWRLYVYAADGAVADVLTLAAQSAYLFGRDRQVADVPLADASCSQQHAVLQWRETTVVPRGTPAALARPRLRLYLVDLDSTGGTRVNRAAVPASTYYEVRPGDVIRFAQAPFDYVIVDENAVA
ncbi:hypothetical protein CXG81DRAFT_13608, partial [Caulochytrium protostelioides]